MTPPVFSGYLYSVVTFI